MDAISNIFSPSNTKSISPAASASFIKHCIESTKSSVSLLIDMARVLMLEGFLMIQRKTCQDMIGVWFDCLQQLFKVTRGFDFIVYQACVEVVFGHPCLRELFLSQSLNESDSIWMSQRKFLLLVLLLL